MTERFFLVVWILSLHVWLLRKCRNGFYLFSRFLVSVFVCRGNGGTVVLRFLDSVFKLSLSCLKGGSSLEEVFCSSSDLCSDLEEEQGNDRKVLIVCFKMVLFVILFVFLVLKGNCMESQFHLYSHFFSETKQIIRVNASVWMLLPIEHVFRVLEL